MSFKHSFVPVLSRPEKHRKALILTDFEPARDWWFGKALQENGCAAEIRYCENNGVRKSGMNEFLRLLQYVFFPLSQLRNYGKFDVIIGWQQFFALNLAFWLRFFHVKKRSKIICMTFIYKTKSGILGKVYYRYMKWIVNSHYIDSFIVHSRNEVERYADIFKCGKERFHFVRLVNDILAHADSRTEPFVFSTGRSNRKFQLLYALSEAYDIPVKIATDTFPPKVPPRVEILQNCSGDAMLSEMMKCFCVVIPLEIPEVSSGQLTCLQAMMCGKPVICTRSSALEDYVSDGETGLFFDNTVDSLKRCIDLLSDRDFYNRISNNARDFCVSECTPKEMARKVLSTVGLDDLAPSQGKVFQEN